MATEIGWFDLKVFLGFWIVGVILVFLAAVGFTVAVDVLGFALAGAAHACIAALLVGLAIEFLRPGWTTLGWIAHLVMAAIVVALLVGVVLLDRFVVHLGLGGDLELVYFVVAGVGAVVAGVLTWLVMSPKGFTGTGEAFGVHCFVAVLALVLSALVMVLTIAGLAWYRSRTLGDVAVSVPVVRGISGEYVAMGDSYSAGEGLRPFNAHTGPVSDGGDGCDRSQQAYSQLLEFSPHQPAERFPACSGAVSRDIFTPFAKRRDERTKVALEAQVDGEVHPEVGLVTITIGGNDVLFSKIVTECFVRSDCMTADFDPPKPDRVAFPKRQPLDSWATAAAKLVGDRVAVIYAGLRRTYPNARIVVLGYPYLFPDTRASWVPDDCSSILRRFSKHERDRIRQVTDRFNALLYLQAVRADVEFVSPVAIWDGHEPCGDKGQYTNSIKPILNFSNPVDGGSFHPNPAGQKALAALVACYLNTYREPPSVPRGAIPHALTNVENPSLPRLGGVDAPGSRAAPLDCRNIGDG